MKKPAGCRKIASSGGDTVVLVRGQDRFPGEIRGGFALMQSCVRSPDAWGRVGRRPERATDVRPETSAADTGG